MEYQKIQHIVSHALPTMAISTMKCDENMKPKRAKWIIVALGNLDPQAWSTNDFFAPVISMIEFRFLVSLAVHHKQTLRSGDIKQAFCQATPIPDETYVLCPPCKVHQYTKNQLLVIKTSPLWIKTFTETLVHKSNQIISAMWTTSHS